MVDYNAARTVIDASRDELIEIFRWVQARIEDERYPLTVLIGGWAVYIYNPWYGSVDIDLITNSRARQHLMKYLRDERGFVHKRHPMIPNTVVKHIPEGEILIDFGSREDVCRFEGRAEECPFSLLDGRTEVREIRAGSPVVVPERTLLLVFKLKAAWDRLARIRGGTSYDEEWEQGKLRKDRADILALLDPAAGGTEIDIQYFGERLREFPFLAGTLREIPPDMDAVAMYRRMDPAQARDVVERLLLLIE
ncbi:MAG: hypothetical protein OS112_07495 [Methanoregula sp.]|nr:MAG: hypothetical protein OS112_07495 [Methanoregula sp.]